jgi:hypothetical protein
VWTWGAFQPVLAVSYSSLAFRSPRNGAGVQAYQLVVLVFRRSVGVKDSSFFIEHNGNERTTGSPLSDSNESTQSSPNLAVVARSVKSLVLLIRFILGPESLQRPIACSKLARDER